MIRRISIVPVVGQCSHCKWLQLAAEEDPVDSFFPRTSFEPVKRPDRPLLVRCPFIRVRQVRLEKLVRFTTDIGVEVTSQNDIGVAGKRFNRSMSTRALSARAAASEDRCAKCVL